VKICVAKKEGRNGKKRKKTLQRSLHRKKRKGKPSSPGEPPREIRKESLSLTKKNVFTTEDN